MCSSEKEPIAVAVPDTADVGPAPSQQLIDDLVVANHILFDQGVVDGFGHVSVRHDKNPDHFLLARNMAPGRVTADDIIEFTLDGDPINANSRKVYLERFIHGEIYRRRPDVKAVVHSHSHAIVPLSIVKNFRMKAVFHMAGFVGQDVPIYEIREAGGDATDLLVSNNRLGCALAEKFDASDIVLMRGHGSTVVGDNVQRAVYRAIYAELNARYLLDATKLGEVVCLTEGECRAAAANVEAQVQRPWDLWVEQAHAKRSGR